MTLHAALNAIAPGEACVFSLRVMKHADGRIDKPKLVASTDAGSLVGHSLAELVALAARTRVPEEADEIIGELETVS